MRLIKKKEQDGEFKPNYKNNHIKCKQLKHVIEDGDCQIGQKKAQHSTLEGAYKKHTLNTKIEVI